MLESTVSVGHQTRYVTVDCMQSNQLTDSDTGHKALMPGVTMSNCFPSGIHTPLPRALSVVRSYASNGQCCVHTKWNSLQQLDRAASIIMSVGESRLVRGRPAIWSGIWPTPPAACELSAH